jgi:hypothetical protein
MTCGNPDNCVCGQCTPVLIITENPEAAPTIITDATILVDKSTTAAPVIYNSDITSINIESPSYVTVAPTSSPSSPIITSIINSGTQGVQGTQGKAGADAVDGTQGVQGLQGVQGPVGSQGIHGSQGTQGVQGVQGVQGFHGDKGDKGDQGIQGVQGTTPELPTISYVYHQNFPSNSWHIVHNLNFYPSLTIEDSAGSIVEGEVAYLNVNEIIVTFTGGGFSGIAYLS